jgi:hypothetical protein
MKFTIPIFYFGCVYTGISADGQYFRLGVPKYLDEHYEHDGHHDHDPMHRAGLVDTHLRNAKRQGFDAKWLNDLTNQIGSVFEVYNWGKEFEHLLSTAKQLSEEGYDINLKLPRFYSVTKFANSVVIVYSSFMSDILALRRSIEESQEELRDGTSGAYFKGYP